MYTVRLLRDRQGFTPWVQLSTDKVRVSDVGGGWGAPHVRVPRCTGPDPHLANNNLYLAK